MSGWSTSTYMKRKSDVYSFLCVYLYPPFSQPELKEKKVVLGVLGGSKIILLYRNNGSHPQQRLQVLWKDVQEYCESKRSKGEVTGYCFVERQSLQW